MKKYSFWINAFLLTFLLGVIGVMVWFTLNNNYLEAVKPPPLLKQNCIETANFPGLAKKIFETPKGRSYYFPKRIFGNDMATKDSVAGWYSNHLKAMNENSLLDISDTKVEVYRFLWLRSFHHPIFVRIERNQNEIKLFTKELNGAGGYEPKEILRDYKQNLNETEWCFFLNLLRKTNYWQMPTNQTDNIGNDGAEWILEGVKNGYYHAVDRWSPAKENNYAQACIYLLKLSGVDTDKLGDDLY